MHGPAVASIAVGESVGVAPGAELYFIAETHARFLQDGTYEFELSSLAQAIDRIVEIDRLLPRERRIRVISISLGINPAMAGYDLATAAIARAAEHGVYAVFVGSERFFGLGRGPRASPERPASYGPGQFWTRNWSGNATELMVPMGSRCTAAPTGSSDYAFYRVGGMRWAVPSVAGLYALACQVEPDVTPEEFWEVARRTSVVARAGIRGRETAFGHILSPTSLIGELRQR